MASFLLVEGVQKAWQKVKFHVAIVLLMFAFAVMYVLSAATLKNGMNKNVLVVYRNIFATAVMIPVALWFERNKRPEMTLLIFLRILGLALLEPVLQQRLYYMAVKLTSASFVSALENIIPTCTFILALIFRMERLDIKQRGSQAKVIGTFITITGAILMIFYRGPAVLNSETHNEAAASTGHEAASLSWFRGTMIAVGAIMCWSLFLILQSNTLKSYPAELTVTALICSLGAGMSAAVTLLVERGAAKEWIIGWDMKLITAIYSGVVTSGISYYVMAMVMKVRGPVFVSAFDPLAMIITAILGCVFLKEEISLGMIIGSIIVVVGLYSLLWGKSKDQLLTIPKNEKEDGGATSNNISSCSIDANR